jgi:outer membrane protein TolC
MKTLKILLIITISFIISTWFSLVYSQVALPSLDSVFNYVKLKSITLQTGELYLLQSKKAKLAAIVSIPEVTGGANLNFTNNTKLPVSLFPAEVFGGTPGTFQEIQTGIQYNTLAGLNIDVKVLNLAAVKNLQLAKTDIEVNQTNNLLNQKSLYENIAATYFNILQLKAQSAATRRNVSVSSSLIDIVREKYAQGMSRPQDVNDAQISLLDLEETVRQIDLQVSQQYLQLKILADIDETENIYLTDSLTPGGEIIDAYIAPNTLGFQNANAKARFALQSFKQVKNKLLPTLSIFAGNNFNQYNQALTLFGGKWIHSQFLGFKLNLSIPSANDISNLYKLKYDYEIADKNAVQAQNKEKNQQAQLGIDLVKASSQFKTNREVQKIRSDSYYHQLNLYKEGMIGLDVVLNSFSLLVTSEYNTITALANIQLANAKIKINNNIR